MSLIEINSLPFLSRILKESDHAPCYSLFGRDSFRLVVCVIDSQRRFFQSQGFLKLFPAILQEIRLISYLLSSLAAFRGIAFQFG